MRARDCRASGKGKETDRKGLWGAGARGATGTIAASAGAALLCVLAHHFAVCGGLLLSGHSWFLSPGLDSDTPLLWLSIPTATEAHRSRPVSLSAWVAGLASVETAVWTVSKGGH